MASTTTQTDLGSAIALQPFSNDNIEWIRDTHQSNSQRQLQAPETDNIRQDAAPPASAVEALQQWNYPRANMYRTFSTFWSFFTVGMNDGSYGVSCLQFSYFRMLTDGNVQALIPYVRILDPKTGSPET